MRKLLYTLLLTLAACGAMPSTQAQTRTPRGTTPARRRTPTQPTRPTPTPAPKATTTTTAPAQSPSAQSATARADSCGCELPLPEVLAAVNGMQITQKDISQQTLARVRNLQQQVVEARNRELDLIINSKLLEAEAKKRGVASSKLIDQEVISKARQPTEAEAQAFYDQNKASIQSQAGAAVEFKDVKGRIVEYLRDQREREEARKFAEKLRATAQVQKVVNTATPPSTPAERERLLATVNGERITSGDVENNLRPLIYEVQDQSHRLYRSDVDLKINDILLEQEAQKRKVTTNALLDAEVGTKLPTVTEADAQTFYNQNKERIGGDFAQMKNQIIQYLQQREQEKAQVAFAQRLRNAASVQNFLTPPTPPVYEIAIDDQPVKGNPSATVTLVEFTDFQCPSCAQTQPIIERLAKEYADRVRVVVRDYPLAQHENAFKAAEAAEAAREQGKYWEYVSVLFTNQSALEVARLKEYASQLGLDRQKFDAALDSGRFADKVQRDLQDGLRVGVNSTPTIFINGRRTEDRSYEGLKANIEAALKGVGAVKK